MKLSGNKILITGGASGIGFGLTERFITEANSVIICGRREEVLEEVKVKFPSVITKVCDLSKEEDRIELYKWISENHSEKITLAWERNTADFIYETYNRDAVLTFGGGESMPISNPEKYFVKIQ